MMNTWNHPARRNGFRLAIYGFVYCENCVSVSENRASSFNRDCKASSKVRDILKEHDDKHVMGSLDEAYLNKFATILNLSQIECEKVFSSYDWFIARRG